MYPRSTYSIRHIIGFSIFAYLEIVGNNFESGSLGPGTIVGSAAFNLMGISAVCVAAIPGVESRQIKGYPAISYALYTAGNLPNESKAVHLLVYLICDLIKFIIERK